jgi:hypothetical protein
MRSPRIAAWAAGLLVAWAAPAGAQDAARAIVEQAVKAHGGEERLARARADKVKYRGTLFVPGALPVPFVAETTVQLPSQYKTVMEVTPAKGDKHTFVHLVNGDKITLLVDGQPPRQTDPAALAELRDTMQLDRAARLVPLLQDRSYELGVLDEIKVNDRPAVGVRVAGRGRKELRLYFDKELGLLVKTEHLLDDGNGKRVRLERYFGDFKDIGGYKRPLKVLALHDGKKVLEAEVFDVKYFDKIDDREFTPP